MDTNSYWPLGVAAGNVTSTSPVTITWTKTTSGTQTGMLMIVIKSAAGGSIVEADATITASSTDAFEGQKLLAMLAAVDAASTDAYLGSKVLGTVGDQTATSTDAWVGTGVSAGVAALTASSTDAYVSGSILAAVWAAVGDAACLFESNAVATGEADMVSTGDAQVAFTITAVSAGEGGFTASSADQYLGGMTIAADMVSEDTASNDDFMGTAIRSAVAQLVADAIVAWQTGAIPGDGGATTPASLLRRMRREAQQRVMTSARPSRKMTR
jgi:hypothetical protein